MHPRDVHCLKALLLKLRDKGNTVLVIENDPDVIKIADHIIEMGPKAGKQGGQLMFEDSYSELKSSETLIGQSLRNQTGIKEKGRLVSQFYKGKPSSMHNLKNISLNIPQKTLTVLTGVAGSGKSTHAS